MATGLQPATNGNSKEFLAWHKHKHGNALGMRISREYEDQHWPHGRRSPVMAGPWAHAAGFSLLTSFAHPPRARVRHPPPPRLCTHRPKTAPRLKFRALMAIAEAVLDLKQRVVWQVSLAGLPAVGPPPARGSCRALPCHGQRH